MIPSRVIGYAKDTGKLYQAMRGERDARQWRWIEVTHELDSADVRGDIVFTWPTIDQFPLVPPQRSNVSEIEDAAPGG